MAVQLPGSIQSIALGDGYAIRAPGVIGSAELKRPHSATERSRSRTVDDGTASMPRPKQCHRVRQIEISLQPPPRTLPTRALRSIDGRGAAGSLGADLGAGRVVLACDETGVLTGTCRSISSRQGPPSAAAAAPSVS
jgi:hypothetical protein